MDKMTEMFAPVYKIAGGANWMPCVPRGAGSDAAYKYPYNIGIQKKLRTGRYYLYERHTVPCAEFVERMGRDYGAVVVASMRVFGVGQHTSALTTNGYRALKYKSIIPLEIMCEVPVPKKTPKVVATAKSSHVKNGVVLGRDDLEVYLDSHGHGFDIHIRDKASGTLIASTGVEGLHKWNNREGYDIVDLRDPIHVDAKPYNPFQIVRG